MCLLSELRSRFIRVLVQGPGPGFRSSPLNLHGNDTSTQVFYCKFAAYFRTSFYKNIFEGLLLLYFTHFTYHLSLHIHPLIDPQKQLLGNLLRRSSPTRSGVVVITTAQLHLTKPEFRFCASLNPARGVSEIRNGEDL